MRLDQLLEFLVATLITGGMAVNVYLVASLVTWQWLSATFFFGSWLVIGLATILRYLSTSKKPNTGPKVDLELEYMITRDEAESG